MATITPTNPNPPLPLGTVVKPYGKLGAILLTGGERYYLFSKERCVSMIPAFMVDPPRPQKREKR